jgi:hypothetical protein
LILSLERGKKLPFDFFLLKRDNPMSKDADPEILIIPIPPFPGGVDIAAIV